MKGSSFPCVSVRGELSLWAFFTDGIPDLWLTNHYPLSQLENVSTNIQGQGDGETKRSPDVNMIYCTEAALKAACFHWEWPLSHTQKAIYHRHSSQIFFFLAFLCWETKRFVMWADAVGQMCRDFLFITDMFIKNLNMKYTFISFHCMDKGLLTLYLNVLQRCTGIPEQHTAELMQEP